jgi:HEAT repeat protein
MTTVLDHRSLATDDTLAALAEANRIVSALNGAFKKRNLYSRSHDLYQSALSALKVLIDGFINEFGMLRLDLEKDRLGFQGHALLQGQMGPADLWYVMFRDGILWLSFRSAPELWELDTFLDTAHQHLTLAEDAEDDMVTALWAFDFASIAYETADLELSSCELIDLSQLPCRPDGMPDAPEPPGDDADRAHGSGFRQAVKDMPSPDPGGQLQLTPEERARLAQMVSDKEKLYGTDDVVDVLFYILAHHVQTEIEVTDLLESVRQELGRALRQLRYDAFHRVLSRMQAYIDQRRSEAHPSTPGLEAFYQSISRDAFVQELTQDESGPDACASEDLNHLKRALLLLSESAIPALGSLLTGNRSAAFRRIILETIGTMAARNFQPLEKLLESAQPALARELVFILGYLKDPRSRRMLSTLLRSESEDVRGQALNAILKRGNGAFKDLAALIDDPDERIRNLALNHLGQERNRTAEQLLLDYLKANRFPCDDPDRLFAVCRTLGKCGSDASLPLLQRQLCARPLPAILVGPGRKVRRKAALIALEGLQTEQAAELIAKSAKGLLVKLFGGP